MQCNLASSLENSNFLGFSLILKFQFILVPFTGTKITAPYADVKNYGRPLCH